MFVFLLLQYNPQMLIHVLFISWAVSMLAIAKMLGFYNLYRIRENFFADLRMPVIGADTIGRGLTP